MSFARLALLTLLPFALPAQGQTFRPAGSVVMWGSTLLPYVEPGTQFTAITAGGGHTVALKSDGSVVAWGRTSFIYYFAATVPAAAQSGVTAIAAGEVHTAVLKTNGSVVAWGSDEFGQAAVPVAAQSGVVAIAAGSFHTVALKNDGSVVAWGDNSSGQTTVPMAAQSGVAAIAAGSLHTVALKEDGSILAWGDNSFAQAWAPGPGAGGVTAIAPSGSDYALALKSNGSVVAWGESAGRTPVPAAAQSGVTAIAAGPVNGFALKGSGSVVAWGDNRAGQLNVPVAAQSGVTAIAAAGYHVLALKSDGSFVTWGNNEFGQTTVPYGLRPAFAVAAGGHSTVALIRNPALTHLGVQPAEDGLVRIRLAGEIAERYVLEESEDLIEWSPIHSNTLNSAGLDVFIDATAPHRTRGFYRTRATGKTNWRFVSKTGNARSSVLYVFLSGAGSIYLDQIHLVAGDTPEVGVNLVRNGDFESDLSGPWIVPENYAATSITSQETDFGENGSNDLAYARAWLAQEMGSAQG